MYIKPAIVLVAYNRPDSLKRLLKSLAQADYTGYEGIPLVISIDYSDCTQVSKLADNFSWEFGSKEIIKHEKNLGLKAHIISCGDLTQKYDAVIVLEDDLLVSPAFYDYTCKAINFYKSSFYVSGISLYSYEFNEYARMRFIPLDDGFDNYFLQSATSWGQAWTREQWHQFKHWYELYGSLPIDQEAPLPEDILNKWSERSWKKYFIWYMILEKKYFVVPRVSLTTNFADIGSHLKIKTNNYQVSLIMNKKQYNFSQINESKAIYDSHYEMEPACLKFYNKSLENFNFECDFSGTKNLKKVKSDYLITIRNSLKSVVSYKLELLPNELNVIYDNYGDFFNLSRVQDCQSLDIKKKLFQYKCINQDAGVKRFASLFTYDLIERIIG